MEEGSGQQGTPAQWQIHSSRPPHLHGVVFVGGACLLNILNPQSDLTGEGFLGNVNQLDEYCKLRDGLRHQPKKTQVLKRLQGSWCPRLVS